MTLQENVQRLKPKLLKLWTSYRALLLVVLAGAVLLLIPSGNAFQTREETPEETTQPLDLSQEEARLEDLLEDIRGVGRVKVRLTLEDDGEKIYALEKSETREQGENTLRESADTSPTLYTISGGGEEPLLEQTRTPGYRGAVVVCDGADDPAIKLQLLQSLQALLGLSSDRVAILPMQPVSE